MKNKVAFIVVFAIFLAVMFSVRFIASETVATNEYEAPELTRDYYLELVEEKYDPAYGMTLTETKCLYTYLIDRYGVQETARMDQKAIADPAHVDTRVEDAIRWCL